jgi:hypothetical protein
LCKCRTVGPTSWIDVNNIVKKFLSVRLHSKRKQFSSDLLNPISKRVDNIRPRLFFFITNNANFLIIIFYDRYIYNETVRPLLLSAHHISTRWRSITDAPTVAITHNALRMIISNAPPVELRRYLVRWTRVWDVSMNVSPPTRWIL